MWIADCYQKTLREIKCQYIKGGCNHEADYGYKIPLDISLEGAIKYTGRYDESYRYERYHKALGKMLEEKSLFSPANRRVVNLDLGCGAGFFSWIVRDYMLEKYGKNDGDIRLIGYDRAESMIRLAALFRKHLPMGINFTGYSKIGKIKKVLSGEDFSDCDVIVTLGHVLIQTKDNDAAIRGFCNIIRSLFPANCCVLVAVDAITRAWAFHDAWKNFRAALEEAGVNMESEKSIGSSSMCARLSMGERDGSS